MEVVRATFRKSPIGKLLIELETDIRPASRTPEMNVTLKIITKYDTEFFANFSCAYNFFASLSSVHGRALWTAQLDLEPSAERRLVELAAAKIQDVPIAIQSSRLHWEPESAGVWLTGELAEGQLNVISQAHRDIFDVPIVVDGNTEDHSFRTVLLVDNLYLTRPRRLPGVQIFPVNGPLVAASIINATNSILSSFGFDGVVETSKLPAQVTRQRPSAVIFVPKIFAFGPDNAHREAVALARRMLDLFTLQRRDRPRLLTSVVGKNEDGGNVSFAGMWLEGGSYRGNLIGGFISGENQRDLLQYWNVMRADPRITLWMSLYAEGVGDPRWDYGVFRCFNLLEGIATETVPSNAPVVDGAGTPLLQSNGRAYTTANARGKLYVLVRMMASAMNSTERSYAPTPGVGGGISLWDWLGLWVTIRNEVAHTGTWDIPVGRTPTTRRIANIRTIEALSHDGTLSSGEFNVLSTARRTVDSTLYALLSGRL